MGGNKLGKMKRKQKFSKMKSDIHVPVIDLEGNKNKLFLNSEIVLTFKTILSFFFGGGSIY